MAIFNRYVCLPEGMLKHDIKKNKTAFVKRIVMMVMDFWMINMDDGYGFMSIVCMTHV